MKNLPPHLWLVLAIVAGTGLTPCLQGQSLGDKEILDGPAYSKFKLTLSDGWREEIASPFYYFNKADSQSQWALWPAFCQTRTRDVDWEEWELCYPVLDYRRFGGESRLQVMEVLSFSRGVNQEDDHVHQFTLFPIYFQQRATDPRLNYTAVFPFYGHLVNRLFRDDIRFVMFPIYSETRFRDRITDNYLYPIFDRARGAHYSGGQFWPIAGHKHETPFLTTNVMGDVETNAGFDHKFVLWPFYSHEHNQLGTTNPIEIKTFVPFYSRSHSPSRDSKSYGWPFGYNIVDDREAKYTERDWFWPAYVKARGSKTEDRYFPFYSDARTADLESKFIIWPIYKYNSLTATNVFRKRTRIALFLYSDTVEKSLPDNDFRRRVDFWPLYTYHRQFGGSERLQVFAPLEPLFPNNRSITREYAQGWSFWRDERNPQIGAASQSLFWNLYRREIRPHLKKYSLLFGLFQYQSTPEGASWRVCGARLGKKINRAAAARP